MKTGKRDSKRNARGMVLPLVISIAVVLAILGIGLIQLGYGSQLMAVLSTSGISARAAADAGVADALYRMNEAFIYGTGPGPLPVPVVDRPLDNAIARYSYEVILPPNPAERDARWVIRSTGRSGREVRRVYALARVTNLFDYGLIVTDKITLKSNTLVDGYDSGPFGTDPYGVPNARLDVKIGTTSPDPGMIWLGQEPTTVTGDVLVGIGGSLSGKDSVITNPSGGASTGNRYNLPQPWEFEPITVTVPPSVPYSANINSASPWDGTGSIRVGTPGVPTYWRYNNIDVPNSRRLIFVGPVEVHVTGNITLDNSATIFVGDPENPTVASSLIIYLDGDLRAGNSNGINNLSRWPRNFRLFGTGPPVQDWDVANGGAFYGVYYAPNADITIYAQGEVYGSISGLRFELKSGAGGTSAAGVHYDQNLADLNQYDTGFAIDRWWEEVVLE